MDFLHSKASNFRKMLEEQPQTPEAQDILKLYNEAELESLIKTHLLPLYLVNQLDAAVTKVMEVYPLLDKSKVKRYFSCFCECILKSHIG